jgi:hypothetical protein
MDAHLRAPPSGIVSWNILEGRDCRSRGGLLVEPRAPGESNRVHAVKLTLLVVFQLKLGDRRHASPLVAKRAQAVSAIKTCNSTAQIN